MKQVVLALQVVFVLLVIGAAGVLGHLHASAQTYHPVVRLASPDGLTFTAVQDATSERQACGAANERFLVPIKQRCKECKVVIARCERQLEGLEQAIYDGTPIPYHRVMSPGMRMAIVGPEEAAKMNCDFVAGELRKSGVRAAACIDPAKS
jgi:hypothetical protein